MFTVRNLGGVALMLAGTTWLWLTPAFASRGVDTSGAMWATTRVLSWITIVMFCGATWGLFARQGWWETVALGSSEVGLVAVVAFWIAARGGGETVGTVMWNTFVHVAMVAGVVTLLLVPQLERWVDRHVMGGVRTMCPTHVFDPTRSRLRSRGPSSWPAHDQAHAGLRHHLGGSGSLRPR